MFEASDVMAAINRVLTLNNQQMITIINQVNQGIDSHTLLTNLSIIMARSETLEILTEELCGYEIDGFVYGGQDTPEQEIDLEAAEFEIGPDFIKNVENDTPDGELPDEKKLAEERRTFMS